MSIVRAILNLHFWIANITSPFIWCDCHDIRGVVHAVLHRIEWRSTGGLLKEETRRGKYFWSPQWWDWIWEMAARGQSMWTRITFCIHWADPIEILILCIPIIQRIEWPYRISEACKDMEIHFKWDYLKWSMVFHCVYSAQFFIVSLFGRKLWNYIEWHGILFILFKMVNGKLVVLHINEKGK